jgi:LPXTG-motif cell wall-anchored protein
VNITVSKSGITYDESTTLSSSGNGITYDEETGVYKLLVTNSAGEELPHTGGTGTLPYTLGGIAMILASAAMYGFRMRRKRKEVN